MNVFYLCHNGRPLPDLWQHAYFCALSPYRWTASISCVEFCSINFPSETLWSERAVVILAFAINIRWEASKRRHLDQGYLAAATVNGDRYEVFAGSALLPKHPHWCGCCTLKILVRKAGARLMAQTASAVFSSFFLLFLFLSMPNTVDFVSATFDSHQPFCNDLMIKPEKRYSWHAYELELVYFALWMTGDVRGDRGGHQKNATTCGIKVSGRAERLLSWLTPIPP